MVNQGDPAPALGRGLRLLRLLDHQGACSLEQLAAATSWPKSSLLRLLGSMERAGLEGWVPLGGGVDAVNLTTNFKPPTDGALMARLEPVGGPWVGLRDACAAALSDLARLGNGTAELHAWDGRELVMVDRVEDEHSGVSIHARIGWRRELSEADALTQVLLSWGGLSPRRRYWIWRAGERQQLPRGEVDELLDAAREQGAGSDPEPNGHGVWRQAAPLFAGEAQLVGVLALARAWTPTSEDQRPSLRHLARRCSVALGAVDIPQPAD